MDNGEYNGITDDDNGGFTFDAPRLASPSRTACSCWKCHAPANLVNGLFCPKCGTTLDAIAGGYFDQPRPGQIKNQASNHNCPRCQSSNTQSFEMAHDSGTSYGRYSGAGYDSNFHPVDVSGRSFDQTNLAAYTSPPPAPRPFLFALILTFAILMLSFFQLVFAYFASPLRLIVTILAISGLVAIPWILSFFYAQMAYKNYKERLQRWARSWICLRCGATWELN